MENYECTLNIKLQGECNDAYCQPLFGFGDDSKYFIASYLADHPMNETKVYPPHSDDSNLAEGDITTILTNYSGTARGRDDQFYDAVTSTSFYSAGSDAFSHLHGSNTENSWPIHLKIQQKDNRVTIELGDGIGYWSTPFATNAPLYFGILDRVARDDVVSDFGGFMISLITISGSCTELPTDSLSSLCLSIGRLYILMFSWSSM